MLCLCVSDPDAHESIRNRLGSEDPNLEHPFVNPKSITKYFRCSICVFRIQMRMDPSVIGLDPRILT